MAENGNVARDFDDVLETSLTFTIRGETFTLRDVRPEVIAAWEDEENAPTAAAGLTMLDDKIAVLLASDDDRTRWRELREREENPVTLRQVKALVEWIVEVQSDRPTEPPSSSPAGRGRPEASSSGRSR